MRLVVHGATIALRLPHHRPDRKTFEERLLGAELGVASRVGPLVLGTDPASGVIMCEWIDGYPASCRRSGSVSLGTKSDIAWRLGGVLRRVHDSAGSNTLRRVDLVALAQTLNTASIFQEIAIRLGKTQTVACPSHGDLVATNILIEPHGTIRLIDWDYAGWHDPCWDVAYAIQELGFDDNESAAFMTGYGRSLTPTRLILFRALITAINAAWRTAKGLDAEQDLHLTKILSEHPAILDALKALDAS